MTAFEAKNFRWSVDGKVATITLNRPERKNALTFAAYDELIDAFQALRTDRAVKAVVISGAGENFCSGGDVHDIIGPLIRSDAAAQLRFAQMTGSLVKAMLAAPQPVIAAVDGACTGAGAILAMASELRLGTARARVAFLFPRVGLGGCDMGACAMLPRIVGQGRAAELLFTGRFMDGSEAQAFGFFNRLCEPGALAGAAAELAASLAAGPTMAHAMTKRMLYREWAMALDEAIDAEALAQAELMGSGDFRRAYDAFVEKRAPAFEGD